MSIHNIGYVLHIGWQIFYDALRHFVQQNSWAFASHVTLSTLLALFPFLIFATTLAGFFDARIYTQTSLNYIIDMLPEALVRPMRKDINEVMTVQRGGLLTLSVVTAIYFASSGVESLRTALNLAYRVREKRGILFCRIQSILFIILGTLGFLAISLLLVLAPLMLAVAQKNFPVVAPYIGTIRFWRYLIAILILVIGLVVAHKWLPAGRRNLADIFPGIVITFIAWLVASMAFARYLASFAHYVSLYAGLASLMVALIFLHMLATIFIFGAEINAALVSWKAKSWKAKSWQKKS